MDVFVFINLVVLVSSTAAETGVGSGGGSGGVCLLAGDWASHGGRLYHAQLYTGEVGEGEGESAGWTWEEARQQCLACGADLAVISSQQEMDFTLSIIPQSSGEQGYWINMRGNGTHWVTAGGTPVTFGDVFEGGGEGGLVDSAPIADRCVLYYLAEAQFIGYLGITCELEYSQVGMVCEKQEPLRLVESCVETDYNRAFLLHSAPHETSCPQAAFVEYEACLSEGDGLSQALYWYISFCLP